MKIPSISILITCFFAGLFVFLGINNSDSGSGQSNYKNIDLDFVEIADDQEEREEGLMNRESLCDSCGMLFVFEGEEYRSFWMKNTQISLDMIFLDSDGEIVTIHKNTNPFQESPSYESSEPAQYVLEVNAGFCGENNLEKGNYLDIDWLFSLT